MDHLLEWEDFLNESKDYNFSSDKLKELFNDQFEKLKIKNFKVEALEEMINLPKSIKFVCSGDIDKGEIIFACWLKPNGEIYLTVGNQRKSTDFLKLNGNVKNEKDVLKLSKPLIEKSIEQRQRYASSITNYYKDSHLKSGTID